MPAKRTKNEREPIPFNSIDIPSGVLDDKPRAASSSPIRRRSRSPLNFIRKRFSRSPSPNRRMMMKKSHSEYLNANNNKENGENAHNPRAKKSWRPPRPTSLGPGVDRVAVSSHGQYRALGNKHRSTLDSPSSEGQQTNSSISALTQPTLSEDHDSRTDKAVIQSLSSAESMPRGKVKRSIFRKRSPSKGRRQSTSPRRVKVRVEKEEQVTIIPHSEETEIVFENKGNTRNMTSPGEVHRWIQDRQYSHESMPLEGATGQRMNVFESAWSSAVATTGHFDETPSSNTQKPSVEDVSYNLLDFQQPGQIHALNNQSRDDQFQHTSLDTSTTSIVLLDTTEDQEEPSLLQSFDTHDRPIPSGKLLTLPSHNRANEEECKEEITDDVKHWPTVNQEQAEQPRKVFLLLLDPRSKVFELIQLIFPPSTTTLADILSMIPQNATEDVLASQRYNGLIRPESRAVPWTDKKGLAQSHIRAGEILVAIPYEFSTKYINRLGRQIIGNPRIQTLLETTDPMLAKQYGASSSAENRRSKSPQRQSQSNSMNAASTSKRASKVNGEKNLAWDRSMSSPPSAPNTVSTADSTELAVASPAESTMVTAIQDPSQPEESSILYGRACGPLVEQRIEELKRKYVKESPRAEEDFAHLTSVDIPEARRNTFAETPAKGNQMLAPETPFSTSTGGDTLKALPVLSQRRYLDSPAYTSREIGLGPSKSSDHTGRDLSDTESIDQSYNSWSQSVDSSLALRYSQQSRLADRPLQRSLSANAIYSNGGFTAHKSARLKKKQVARQMRRVVAIGLIAMVILYSVDANFTAVSTYQHPSSATEVMGIYGFLQFLLAFVVLVKFQLFLKQSKEQESKCPFLQAVSLTVESLRVQTEVK